MTPGQDATYYYTETCDDPEESLEGSGSLCETRMWGCWEERTKMSVSDPKKERMWSKPEEGSLGNRGGQEGDIGGRNEFPEDNRYC